MRSAPRLRTAPTLRRVDDQVPGIGRIRAGKGFTYRGPDRAPVDDATRDRIRALAIPPAWTDVWICPAPDGHVQATGRDARGRKQYRYHDDWRTAREVAKFAMLEDIRRRTPRHPSSTGS